MRKYPDKNTGRKKLTIVKLNSAYNSRLLSGLAGREVTGAGASTSNLLLLSITFTHYIYKSRNYIST